MGRSRTDLITEEHHEVKEQREEGQAVGAQALLEASSTTVSGSSGAKT
jgi:hypothetical protein